MLMPVQRYDPSRLPFASWDQIFPWSGIRKALPDTQQKREKEREKKLLIIRHEYSCQPSDFTAYFFVLFVCNQKQRHSMQKFTPHYAVCINGSRRQSFGFHFPSLSYRMFLSTPLLCQDLQHRLSIWLRDIRKNTAIERNISWGWLTAGESHTLSHSDLSSDCPPKSQNVIRDPPMSIVPTFSPTVVVIRSSLIPLYPLLKWIFVCSKKVVLPELSSPMIRTEYTSFWNMYCHNPYSKENMTKTRWIPLKLVPT